MTAEGKSTIIKLKKEMSEMSGKWIPSSIQSKIHITKYWLIGFIDAEGSFSTNKHVPRFKLENHIKELELYNKIKEFLVVGNVLLTTPRVYSDNSNPTIVLEINKISYLLNNLIPLMQDNDHVLLKTLKAQDFILWKNLIDLYYKGYHTTLDGKSIFDLIKSIINKHRLSTYEGSDTKEQISISFINDLLSKIYLIDSPYEIKQGLRYIRGTNKLVSESSSIIVIDTNKNSESNYSSMTECAQSLNISRVTIKKYLTSGKSYKGYLFIYKS